MLEITLRPATTGTAQHQMTDRVEVAIDIEAGDLIQWMKGRGFALGPPDADEMPIYDLFDQAGNSVTVWEVDETTHPVIGLHQLLPRGG